MRNQRWGETLVAVAGSATNISLAVIFGLLARFGTALALDTTALALAAQIAFVNLFLGFFNLIPFPPLDGFSALRSALPWRLSGGLRRFEYQIRSMGPASLLLFLLVFSYVFADAFFNLVLRLFSLIVGGGISL